MKIIVSIVCCALLGVLISQAQVKQWSLQECVEHALENNITINQSALNIESADIDKSDAFGNFLPSINISATNFWNLGLSPDPISGTNKTQSSRTSSYELKVGITIFKGLQNIRQFQKAKLSKLSSQYNFEKSKDDIILFIANSYLQILLNKESLSVIEKQHKITIEQLKRTKDLVEAGVLPQGNILEIEATSADELTRIVQAQNSVKISLIGLAQTLLIKDYVNFDIEMKEYLVPAKEILEKPIEEIMSKARESRYEVRIAEQDKLIAEKDLGISRGAYYPTLTAVFNVDTRESGVNRTINEIDPANRYKEIGFLKNTGEPVLSENFLIKEISPTPFFNQFSDNYGVTYGVSLTIPVFNGFSARNAVKRNKINVKRTALKLEQAQLDLDSNVYQAYLDAKGAAEAYEAAIVAVKAQERAYEYSKERYDIGLNNAFDFSQSKFKLENAQSKEIQTKFDFIFKIKVLELYFGIKLVDLKL